MSNILEDSKARQSKGQSVIRSSARLFLIDSIDSKARYINDNFDFELIYFGDKSDEKAQEFQLIGLLIIVYSKVIKGFEKRVVEIQTTDLEIKKQLTEEILSLSDVQNEERIDGFQVISASMPHYQVTLLVGDNIQPMRYTVIIEQDLGGGPKKGGALI